MKNSEDFEIGWGHRQSPMWQFEELLESNHLQIGHACSPVTYYSLSYSIHFAFSTLHEIGKERRQVRVRESPQAFYFTFLGRPLAKHFNPGFSASLSTLVMSLQATITC